MNHNSIVDVRNYQLLGELGRDSWSTTYLAKDKTMPEDFRCVVKRFLLKDGDMVARKNVQISYTNETYIWQKLAYGNQGPSVIASFEEKDLYLVREFVKGQNLGQRLAEDSGLDQAELVKILRDILSSLCSIHQLGFVHQDLKPSNLIIRDHDQQTVIIGLDSSEAITSGSLEQDGDEVTHLVSPQNKYYATERNTAQITPQRDLYALGAIAIEALSGKNYNQTSFHLPVKTFLATEVKQINSDLSSIIEGMMSSESVDGYTSAQAVINDLKNISLDPLAWGLLAEPSKANALASSSSTVHSVDNLGGNNFVTATKNRFNPLLLLSGIFGLFLLVGIGEFVYPILRPQYYCYQGKKSLSAARVDNALSTFRQAIKLNRRSNCGWLGQAKALYRLERYPAALNAYDQADRIKPDQIKTWQGRGEVLYRLERFEAAKTAYNKTLKIQPNNAFVWNRKGKALYKLELYQEALAAQKKAIKLQPDNVQALTDSGIALIGLGQYQKALEAFNQAQEVEPLDPKLWQNKALVLQYLNRPQESIRLYQEALDAYENEIANNPQNITILLDKANVLSKLQRHEEALKIYEQAVSINDNSHLTWLGKGNALFALRKYSEALAAFNRTVKVQPKSYISWHNRGSLLRDGLRNFPDAIASYDRSLEINPNFYHAWRDRGIALSQNQQHEKAIKSFKKALRIKPSDYQSWVAQGIALSSIGKLDEALSVFDRAAKIQPNDPFVWMNQGAVLETAQDYPEACNSYRQVKEINPGFSPAIKKLKQLGCK